MFNSRRGLNLTLVGLLLLSVGLVIIGSVNPLAVRDALCTRVGPCPTFGQAMSLTRVIYDVGTGGLLSLTFYWLLVRLPEAQRRRRIKRSLEKQYRNFKKDCIATILGTADGVFEYALVDRLMPQAQFRAYFNEAVSESQDRWHRFENNLSEHSLRELLTALEIFRDEIAFVLNNTDISNDEPFEFFKRLANAIYANKDTNLDYDSTKVFCRFLWSVFAGFDPVSGYRKTDIVEDMIKSI